MRLSRKEKDRLIESLTCDVFDQARRIFLLEKQRDDLLALVEQAYTALGEYGFAYRDAASWGLADKMKAALAKVRSGNSRCQT